MIGFVKAVEGVAGTLLLCIFAFAGGFTFGAAVWSLFK